MATVLSEAIGIETLGGIFTALVSKGTQLPTTQKQIFSTAEDNQTVVTIRVYKGNAEMASNNEFVGQFDLEGIPLAPKGVPQIEVAFDLDQSGNLSVSAVDKAANKSVSVAMQAFDGSPSQKAPKARTTTTPDADDPPGDRRTVDASAQRVPPDVFVSYKREDRSQVEKIVRRLEAEGLTMWWDPEIMAGERFSRVIDQALSEAKCVIVCWSQTSIDSYWVQDEAAAGRDRGILVPVSIDGTTPPLGFRQFHTQDLDGWNGDASDARITQLINGVRRYAPASQRRADAAQDTVKSATADGSNPNFQGIFDDLFGSAFKTLDRQYTLNITQQQADAGTKARISLSDGATIELRVPAGIKSGQKLRLKGRGETGQDGKRGDAYVAIEIA